MDAPEILVIILSTFLAIFLALGITFLIYSIKIARHLEHITSKAEEAADNISKASTFFQKAAGPAAIGKALVNIYENIRSSSNKKGKK